MPLQSVWVKHLDQQDRVSINSFEQGLRNSVALPRLKDILQEMITQLEGQEVSESQFEFSSWAYLEAFRLGKKHTLKRLFDLVSI